MDSKSKYPLHGETPRSKKDKDCDCQNCKVILESSYGNFGPLDVTFVDENGIPTDCCTYTLELNSISNLDLGTLTYSINGILSALVVENPC